MSEKISEEEKARRRKAINNGIALNSLDGIAPDEWALAMYEKYIEGEFTFEKLEQQLIEILTKTDKT